MNILCTVICLSLCFIEMSSQDITTLSIPNPNRRYPSSLIKPNHPKPFKRSPPFLNPRILNKKTPLSVLHNGPYFINHYIYCDNLDQHTLDQIKSGTFSSDQQIQLLNLQNGGFHGLTPSLDSLESSGFNTGLNDFKTGTYTGDKEIHILHLPKDKPHDIDDIKLHLSLLDAHGSPDTPNIDFDLNRNLGSFEVNLGSIKPPKLDSSFLPTPTLSSLTEVVKPLVQGQINGGLNHKYNIDLGHLTHYFKESTGEKGDLFQRPSIDFSADKEAIEVPHFEQHPLESDPSKSTYDTPGALDSYGHRVIDSHINQNSQFHHSLESGPTLAHLIPNEHPGELSSGFQNGLKNEDFYQPEEFFNQLNEIQELHRKRRQEIKASVRHSESSPSEEKVRHPNHRYD